MPEMWLTALEQRSEGFTMSAQIIQFPGITPLPLDSGPVEDCTDEEKTGMTRFDQVENVLMMFLATTCALAFWGMYMVQALRYLASLF